MIRQFNIRQFLENGNEVRRAFFIILGKVESFSMHIGRVLLIPIAALSLYGIRNSFGSLRQGFSPSTPFRCLPRSLDKFRVARMYVPGEEVLR